MRDRFPKPECVSPAACGIPFDPMSRDLDGARGVCQDAHDASAMQRRNLGRVLNATLPVPNAPKADGDVSYYLAQAAAYHTDAAACAAAFDAYVEVLRAASVAPAGPVMCSRCGAPTTLTADDVANLDDCGLEPLCDRCDERAVLDANAQGFDPEACPGCGCKPGDGLTDGCNHPDGCGHYRSLGEPFTG